METSSEVQKCGIMGIQDWLPTLYAAAGMIPFVIFKDSKKTFLRITVCECVCSLIA